VSYFVSDYKIETRTALSDHEIRTQETAEFTVDRM